MSIDPNGREGIPGSSFPQPPQPPPGSTLLPPTLDNTAGVNAAPQMDDLRKFASSVLLENAANLHSSSRYLSNSYIILLVMYATLFVVGVSTAVAAIIKGFLATDASAAVPSLIFAGLSVTSFLTLFIIRPLESLERNTIFSSWVVAALNTYWTQLMYFNNPQTIHTDLKSATEELVSELSALSDKYATTVGKYAPLTAATPTPNPPSIITGSNDGQGVGH